MPYQVAINWDGRPINSGDKISLGSHSFAIIAPKTESFSTNLFIGYGRYDLGEIRLVRSTGTLSVKADPPAQSIVINGPEFSTNLQDCHSINLKVPTDTYNVSALYHRWSDSRNVSVMEDSVSPVTFSPKFSTIDLSCNRSGTTFQIQNDAGQIQESGSLPATITDLLPGTYQVNVYYHGRSMRKSIYAQGGITNEVPIQYILGAVCLRTVPGGAAVHGSDGNYLGQTPLLLSDMKPQMEQFTFSLSGYEPLSVAVDVTADQTNYCSTNLVSVGYLSAIRDATIYLKASNFEAAVQAATSALNSKPGDPDALEIQNEAGKHLDVDRQQLEKTERPKKWFDSLCSEYPAANLFTAHKLETSKPARDVTMAIVNALTNSPNVFKIMRTSSPEADTYEIVAKQSYFLGINERDCLIVVGSPGDADTQIRFKVLEFEIQHRLTGDNQLIPLSQSKAVNNSTLLLHVQQGQQIVTGKIQKGITQ